MMKYYSNLATDSGRCYIAFNLRTAVAVATV